MSKDDFDGRRVVLLPGEGDLARPEHGALRHAVPDARHRRPVAATQVLHLHRQTPLCFTHPTLFLK